MKLTKKYKIVYDSNSVMLMPVLESAMYNEIHVGEGKNSFETDNLSEAESFVKENRLINRE